MNRRKFLQALTTPLLVMASPAIPCYAAGGYVEGIAGSLLIGESTSSQGIAEHYDYLSRVSEQVADLPSPVLVMEGVQVDALAKPDEPACTSAIQHPIEVFDKRDWLSNEIFEMLRERARLRYKDRLLKTETDAIGLYYRCLVEITVEYYQVGTLYRRLA